MKGHRPHPTGRSPEPMIAKPRMSDWIRMAVIIPACLACALPNSACNPDRSATGPSSGHISHNRIEERRAVSGVRRVEVDLPTLFNLRIEQGDDEGLWIRTEAVTMYYLETRVIEDLLRIRNELKLPTGVRPLPDIELVLTVSDLESVEVTGPGDVEASGLDVERLSLSSTGGAGLSFTDLTASELEVAVMAETTLVSGRVASQDVHLSATGNYSAAGLDSIEASVQVSGTGSATVRVREKLTAIIESSGSIFYSGDPVLESSISGSGRVVQIGE